MSGPNPELQVPFDGLGNQLTYARYYPGDDYVETSTRWSNPRKQDVLWRWNEAFPARLTVVRTERGRSAAHFIWKDEADQERTMFMTDVFDLLQHANIQGGSVFGTWAYRKRGQNYGVYLVTP